MELGTPTDLVVENGDECVRLDIVDGDEVIRCRASREAVEDMVGDRNGGDLLPLAQGVWDPLTWAWMRKIRAGQREPDGSIFLRSYD